MKEVTVTELKKMMEGKEDFQLIDVRETHEVEIANIGGDHIPMGDVMENLDKISRDKKVVIYCRSGNRSGVITQALESQHGFKNIHNMKGGILAWAKEIDPNVS